MPLNLDPCITPIGGVTAESDISFATGNGAMTGFAFMNAMDSDSEPSYGETPANENSKSVRGGQRAPEPTVTSGFYFDHVKTSMTPLQQEDLQARVAKLTGSLDLIPREQKGLREEIKKLLAVSYLQQKAASLGYDKVVTEEVIQEFRHKVEFRSPELMRLAVFPRMIPAEPLAKFEEAKAAGLFDEFYVLTWNPAQEQLKSVTERVIDRDPILFGQFTFDPSLFYYITSWVDEVCDLTFEKMVDAMQETYPTFNPSTVTPLNDESVDYLIKMAQARYALLRNTNSTRYRSDALINQLEDEAFSWKNTRRILMALLRQFLFTSRIRRMLPQRTRAVTRNAR